MTVMIGQAPNQPATSRRVDESIPLGVSLTGLRPSWSELE
jgi:hypothetical protein